MASLLEVNDLRTTFHTHAGMVRAVDGISFTIDKGRVLGIVGESGCGKSVTNLSILRLVPSPPGHTEARSILFDGNDLMKLSEREMRRVRGGRIAMIFQDPMTSLNPFMRVGRQISEATRIHLGHDRKTARQAAIEAMRRVGIPAPERRVDDYPHQFSGGMRQRVMIAMALSCEPDLLIADEPTTALDVTIQAQILDLLKKLRDDTGMAIILVTHDLGVVAGMCDEIVVMYAGRIAEQAPTGELFANPRHPYTRALLASVPRLDEQGRTRLRSIEGLPPDLIHMPPGCAFAPRCPHAQARCNEKVPELRPAGDRHTMACILDE